MKTMTTGLKLQLIVLFAIITATITITFQSIHSIKHLSKENIHKYTQEAYLNEEHQLKNYITIALETINLYYKQIAPKNNTKALKENELQTKKVQQKVLKILSKMRFGESGYFWVNDQTSKMIMHPTHPDLNGKDLSEYKDSNGVKIFNETVKVVNEKGEGFIKYKWPRDGYATAQPKRSYVKLFRPWGWIIGTGEYTDHIEKRIAKMKAKEQQEIDDLISKSIVISAIISLILIFSVSFILKKAIISPIKKREIEAAILKKSAQEYRTLAENSPDIIMRYDAEGNRIYANLAFSEQTGIPKELLVINNPETQWSVYFNMLNMTASEYREKIKQIIKTGESETLFTESIILATGEYIAHEVNIVAERNTNGKIVGALAIGRNVTEQKNIEKRIEFMSHHDILTGFANRTLAKERAKQVIAQARQKGNKVAILFIDLDEFKTVNDSLGHSAGDIMLKMVALRLQECIKANDMISREGGDEFLIILSDVNEKSEIESVVNKLLQKFKQSFNVNNNIITTSASIGIALYPDDGENFDQLFQSADAAMYKAKEIGKNNYRFYTQQMKDDLVGSFQIQNNLQEAIKNKEFVLYYQPQVDLKQNRIIGVEALIRWQHPIQGLIPPLNFISIAESSGLIVQIGEWVLLEACRQAALWNQQGKDIVVAVNISAVQFKHGNLKEVVKNALHVTGLDPKYLELELTESILINDTENILETVKVIKELGIKLSIDDFGTGYSSLSYLKRFAVDKLKIDQSFVRDLLNDKEDASIVKTIIQMAKSFNLKSIAEGVENLEVLTIIEKFGCDEVQGYHFTKPLPLAEFENYYHNYIS